MNNDIAGSYRGMNEEERGRYIAFAFSIKYPGANPAEFGYDESWEYSEELEEAADA
jgi:hypothetical protein